jgi:hypothetical protein
MSPLRGVSGDEPMADPSGRLRLARSWIPSWGYAGSKLQRAHRPGPMGVPVQHHRSGICRRKRGDQNLAERGAPRTQLIITDDAARKGRSLSGLVMSVCERSPGGMALVGRPLAGYRPVHGKLSR